ncbi:hypothetical protein GCM10025868_23030 [Angustibacter aerolatus]|uniref:DUF721 domain-containing protein n=1 Tax=Angustibacter aerolatus TaxID=1162965 RepID=A0ABQ6JFU3_9ACTN|nr:hypothetical protein GCM10025868_23030 [Angustibacter aerolatus]
MGGVIGRWAQVVGIEVAAHSTPESFEEGVLVVRADSTAWATRLRLLAPTLLRRLAEEPRRGRGRPVAGARAVGAVLAAGCPDRARAGSARHVRVADASRPAVSRQGLSTWLSPACGQRPGARAMPSWPSGDPCDVWGHVRHPGSACGPPSRAVYG